MGKLKKGFNWKARQNDVEYQNQTQAKVNIDIDIQEDKYDESNAFVLPSKKLKTEKVKSASIPQQKPLSKKKRRKLEQVMKKKIVGQTRKQLYDELQKFQATPKELRLMTSVSEAQTIGVKRLTSNQIKSNDMMGIRDTSNGPKRKINSIKGSNKLRAKRKKGKLPIPTKESSSSDGSGSDSLISGSLKNGNSIVQTEMHIQTEPAENGNTTIQNEAKDEMDVNVDVCGNKCNENSAIVSLSKKKKTKNMESNSVTPVKSSKKETKMEKQLKQKKFKRKQKKQLNGNLEEAESIEELAVMTSLSEDPTKDDESIESNAEPSDDSMKHVPVLKAEETEMDVGLDACEDKCDENSAVVPSSKKKKTKNVKSKSVIQMNLSKQEGKMKKQLKQKKSKREKKKQLDGNLEEAESINKESVEVTSVSEDQTKDDKRSTNASSQKTPISMLQEQCARLGMTPDYKLMSVEGVVHAPVFMYRVQVGDESATSTGQSKKKAKHAAAKAIIEVLTEKGVFNELGLQSDSLSIDTSVLDSSKEANQNTPNDDGIPGNPVGKLQERCMRNRWRPPFYDTKKEEGLPHERTFEIECSVNGLTEIGCGKSKRLAKRQAAHNMLEKLDELNLDDSKQLPEETKQNGLPYLDLADLLALREKKSLNTVPSNYIEESSNFLKNLKLNKGETLASLQTLDLNENSHDYEDTLQAIGDEHDFPIHYIMLEDLGVSGNYQCLVELSSLPFAVCFGTGSTQENAKQDAAHHALHYLKIMTKK